MTAQRRRRRKDSEPKRNATRKLAPSGTAPPSKSREQPAAPPPDWWARTRSGPTAGRGFHYQDTIGGWLCVQILNGAVDADSVTPEGQDDLVVTGPGGEHFVQAKSKQPGAKPFTSYEVAKLLMESIDRARHYHAARATLCIERPVGDADGPAFGMALADLDSDEPVKVAFETIAAQKGWEATEVADALAISGYWVADFAGSEELALAALAHFYDLQVSQVAEPLFNALRQAVARASDANASTRLSTPHRLTRTDLQAIATEVLQGTDPNHLAAALEQGKCEPVRFDRPLNEPSFYEGVSTQPGHVAAGLVVQPDGLLDDLLDLLLDRSTVLLTGPSGVGKSARAWALAHHGAGVNWYRIMNLDNGAAATIARFARAMRPTARVPVGFVYDHLDMRVAEEWEQLRRHLADVRHAVLLATVRHEDLPMIPALHEVAVREVSLDESAAKAIHDRLRAKGMTSVESWQTAYQASRNLTLEYAHYLTRGQRLAEVIQAQIDARTRDESRFSEIAILALVCQAHAWGASVPATALQTHLELPDSTFRKACSRLVKEHLLAPVDQDELIGLHPLRSRAISDAIHTLPAPQSGSTREALLSLVSNKDLSRLAYFALVDCPPDDIVNDLAHALVDSSAARIAPALRGVRAFDFRRAADRWCDAILDEQVPPALVTATAAILVGNPQPGTVSLDRPVENALARLANDDPNLPCHSRLIELLSLRSILCSLISSPLAGVTEMLSSIGPQPAFEPGHLQGPTRSHLHDLLDASDIDSLADLIATSRWVHTDLASAMLDLAGGSDAVLERLRLSDPFIRMVRHDHGSGEVQASCRFLHISDRLQPDPEEHAPYLATLLLHLLPECQRAEVETELPHGRPYVLNGLHIGARSLDRRNASCAAEAAWNRTRILLVHRALLDRGGPSRQTQAPTLLTEAASLLKELTTKWCLTPNRGPSPGELCAGLSEMSQRADALVMPLGGGPNGEAETELAILDTTIGADPPQPLRQDTLHQLLSGITKNLPSRLWQAEQRRQLAWFCRGTLQIALRDAVDELRPLTPELAATAADLDATLADLHAVLAELSAGDWSLAAFTQVARAGPSATALHRAATTARERAERRMRQRLESFRQEAQQIKLEIAPHTRPISDLRDPFWPAYEHAIGLVVEDIQEWSNALTLATGIIDHRFPPGSPPTLLYPIMDGQAVGQLARTHSLTTLPAASGVFDSWKSEVEPAAPTTITHLVSSAHQSLQEASGLILLCDTRPVGGRPQLRGEVLERFHSAVDTLREQDDPEGVLTEIIDSLVETERDVAGETGLPLASRFAAQITAGETGVEGDLVHWNVSRAVLVASILHDVDPCEARALLRAE